MLAECLLNHSDDHSRTMQATAMPVVEAKDTAELCVETLQPMREDLGSLSTHKRRTGYK